MWWWNLQEDIEDLCSTQPISCWRCFVTITITLDSFPSDFSWCSNHHRLTRAPNARANGRVSGRLVTCERKQRDAKEKETQKEQRWWWWWWPKWWWWWWKTYDKEEEQCTAEARANASPFNFDLSFRVRRQ